MAVQIQLRNDTAAVWTAANPILAIGEMGIETDTDQFKLGDGVTAWNSLGYGGIQGLPGVVSATSPLSYNSQTQNISIDLSTYATQTYVGTQISNLVDSAPAALDTLNELAAALGDDANFASTVTTSLSGKADASHTHNASEIVTTSVDKAASYTLVSSDENTYIRSTGGAITITVPDVLQNGESVNFIQAGTGQITFAGSGITINSADGLLKTAKQFAGATIVKSGGAYYLIGNLG